MTRVGIFIDGGYLKAGLKNFGNAQVDFKKLTAVLAAGDEIFRTYYYNCMPYQSDPPTPQERTLYVNAQRFMDALRFLPSFEVKLGRLRKGYGLGGLPAYQQKGVDTLLSIDLVQLADLDKIDKAILLTGDSDFVPAIKVARRTVKVTLYHFPGTAHNELIQCCDDRIPIDQAVVNSWI